MAYSVEILARAQRELARRKTDAASVYNQRLQLAYEKLPRLREIDRQLRHSMALAAQSVFAQGADAVNAMEQAKQENLALQKERTALLEANFQPGWLEENPVCHRCGGSGYLGSTMCSCLRQLCLQEQKKELCQLTGGADRFEDFRLDYYPDRIDSKIGASPRALMQINLQTAKRFAREFKSGCGNLLFSGNTGLGKTFLSACIANEVAEKGFSIVYESAPRLFSKLEKNRFNPDEESQEAVAEMENCDLLIIDDLGTEMPGNFVTAALYALVNERLLSGKSMLISTNLTIGEIAQRYSPQIASRLQGEFKGMPFMGVDIRVLKNRGV